MSLSDMFGPRICEAAPGSRRSFVNSTGVLYNDECVLFSVAD
jgi:hypothetical protein